MNPDLALLQPYPFERLAKLFAGVEPPPDVALHKLSVGEPQHAPPTAVQEALRENLHLLARYPATRGERHLRQSLATWLQTRHGLSTVDPDRHVLPVNGTREALFAIAQASVSRGALVAMPNPFYQIYEGAALLAGARTALLNCTAENSYLPQADDLSADQWQAMDLLYLCTPGNPAGAVMSVEQLGVFIERALEHDVLLVSDECYSEIYPREDAPPPGLLAACEALGNSDYRNCISMHSLSKRSNLPGLRSGFAAGDPDALANFLRYRGYHGSAMPLHHQEASIVAWSDEAHVRENREHYRAKFAAVSEILAPVLDFTQPDGAFYLWPRTPIDDESFARRLYAERGVIVLPGSYLGREGHGGANGGKAGANPGENRVRLALVAELDNCIEAAQRIRDFCETLC